MKKFLIALPLVLIMLLSMVPVMAAEDITVPVRITWYKDTKGTEAITPADVVGNLTSVFEFNVEEEVAKNAKALGAAVIAEAEKLATPQLKDIKVGCDKGFKFEIYALSTYIDEPAQDAKVIKLSFTGKADQAIEEAKKAGVTVEKSTEAGKEAQEYITAAAVSAIETEANKKVPGTVTLDNNNTTDTAPTAGFPAEVNITVAPATSENKQRAYAYVNAIPVCDMETIKPTSNCVVVCDQITVKLYDVWAEKYIEKYTRSFDVDRKQIPDLKGIYELYINNFFPYNAYRLLPYYDGADWTNIDKLLLGDCVLEIKVLPKWEEVEVWHELYKCCQDPVTKEMKIDTIPYKVFHEITQRVDFIDWHTKLVVNKIAAAEYAKSRIEVMNAQNFVFVEAILEPGYVPPAYLTGKIYDFDGNEINWSHINSTKVVTGHFVELPKIRLIYHEANCVKAEEQVDNATVDANTGNNAPATGSAGAQLPATGAKDVSAFFLSAVALLGLGVFFAKKH